MSGIIVKMPFDTYRTTSIAGTFSLISSLTRCFSFDGQAAITFSRKEVIERRPHMLARLPTQPARQQVHARYATTPAGASAGFDILISGYRPAAAGWREAGITKHGVPYAKLLAAVIAMKRLTHGQGHIFIEEPTSAQ